MPTIEDVLGDLSAHPPSAPRPAGEVRARARRRSRRRRVLVGAAVVLAVAAVGAGVATVVDPTGPRDTVAAGPGGTTTPRSTTTAPPDDTGPPEVVVNPGFADEPVADGDVVGVSLDRPARGEPLAVMAQCAAEAVADPEPASVDAVLAWCGFAPEALVDALVPGIVPYRVYREVSTPNGDVDCGTRAGACVMVVVLEDAGELTAVGTPLVFAPPVDPGPGPAAVIDGPVDQVRDGARLLITLTGVATGDVVTVAQCDADASSDRCSAARSRTITVESGPETQMTFVAFRDVAWPVEVGAEPEWTACDPCALVVRVEGWSEPVEVQPMTMRHTTTPVRPAIEVDPPGPHAAGGTAQVRVTGLQPLVPVAVQPCVHLPALGTCGLQDVPTTVVADHQGVAVAAVPLPTALDSIDCTSAPGACGLGLDLTGQGTDALTFLPLDLSG